MQFIIPIPNQTMSTNIREIVDLAFVEFWDVIAKNFPEATSGDLFPWTSVQLTTSGEDAVREWVRLNVPARRRRQLSRRPQKASFPTPGPWFVDRSSPRSPLCVKPYPGRVVCDIEGSDKEAEANAMLVAAAPDLKSVVELSRIAFEDRLAGLRDERNEHVSNGFDTNVIDDRIAHYEALIRRSDVALKKATTGIVPGSC